MKRWRVLATCVTAAACMLSLLVVLGGSVVTAAPTYNQLTFNPNPIAPPGSLVAGQAVKTICVGAELNGTPVSSFTAYLSFKTLNTEGAPGGTAKVGATTLNGTPSAFTTTTSCVTVAYTAPIPIPTAGRDEIIAQDSATSPVTMNTGAYAFSGPAVSMGPYIPLPPSRICDTRSTGGPPCAGKTLGAGGILPVVVTGVGGVPSTGVSAVVINVTAIGHASASYLKVYPNGESATVSNINFPANTTIANLVEVGVGLQNEVDVYNAVGTADVVMDVQGYIPTNEDLSPTFVPPSTAGLFHPTVPTRICDTRSGTNTQCTSHGKLGAGLVLTLKSRPPLVPCRR